MLSVNGVNVCSDVEAYLILNFLQFILVFYYGIIYDFCGIICELHVLFRIYQTPSGGWEYIHLVSFSLSLCYQMAAGN
jgi:hypothetical protein